MVLFFGEGAWHNLGVTLPADSEVRYNVNQAIQISGLDYRVGKRPLMCDGREVVGHQAVVREDSGEVLGVVGDRYHVLQNRDQFDWFQPYLDTREVAFETCGALMEGRVVWVLAKVNRKDAMVGDDHIRKYLLLTSSHDGSMATSVGFCPIRVVCWNTLSAGLHDRNSTLLKVKHTAKQKDALEAIRETINLVDQTFEATAVQYRRMLACNVSASDLRKYVKLVLELPENETAIPKRAKFRLDNIIELCTKGVGNDGKTAWSAYNGVTQYVTHLRGRTADSRLRAAWYDEGKRITEWNMVRN